MLRADLAIEVHNIVVDVEMMNWNRLEPRRNQRGLWGRRTSRLDFDRLIKLGRDFLLDKIYIHRNSIHQTT